MSAYVTSVVSIEIITIFTLRDKNYCIVSDMETQNTTRSNHIKCEDFSLGIHETLY